MSCIYKYKGKEYSKEEFYKLVETTMVEPRVVPKYNKIHWATGDTASKVEGHTTLEEFKKQKEDRIRELETTKYSHFKSFNIEAIHYSIQNRKYYKQDTIKDLSKIEITEKEYEIFEKEKIQEKLDNNQKEINQLKQELERVETEGFGALKPIFNFYENTVTNILNKQFGKENVKLITDEYGNTWNEITLDTNIVNKVSNFLFNITSNEGKNSLKQKFENFETLKNKENRTISETIEYLSLYPIFKMYKSFNQMDKVLNSDSTKEFEEHRDNQLKDLLNKFLKDFNITKVDLEDFKNKEFQRTGKILPVNGFADLLNDTISFIDGDLDVMSEEVSHFIIAMLPKNSKEYVAINNYLERTTEFEKYYDSYLQFYTERGVEDPVGAAREEIIGKILANSLTGNKSSLPLSLKEILRNIINYISNILNPLKRLEYQEAIRNLNQAFFAENLDYYIQKENKNFSNLLSGAAALDFKAIHQDMNDNTNYFNKRGINENEFTDKVSSELKLVIKDLEEEVKRRLIKATNSKSEDLYNKTLKLEEILNDNNLSLLERISTYLETTELYMSEINNNISKFENELNTVIIPSLREEVEDSKSTIARRVNTIEQVKLSLGHLHTLKSYSDFLRSSFRFSTVDTPKIALLQNILKEITSKNKDFYIKDENIKTLEDLQYLLSTKSNDKRELVSKKIDNLFKKEAKDLINIWYRAEGSGKELTDLDSEMNMTNAMIEIEGILSTTNSFKKFELLSEGQQEDPYLKGVSQLVNNTIISHKLKSEIELQEFNKLHTAFIRAGGDYTNSEWLSALDKNRNPNGKLLLEFDYNKYARNLHSEIKQVILNEFSFNSKFKNSIFKGKGNSVKEIIGNIEDLIYSGNYSSGEIKTLEQYKTVVQNVHNLLHLNYIQSNTGDINLDNEINDEISEVRDRLKKRLDRFKIKPYKLEVSVPIRKVGLFVQGLQAKIQEKKEQLIKDEVTIEVDGILRQKQLDYVNALLRKYSESLGYIVDSDGNLVDSEIRFDRMGLDRLFILNKHNSDAERMFLDSEYLKLERDSLSNSDSSNLSKTKLDIINWQLNNNLKHNLPINHLPNDYKEKNEYTFFKKKKVFNTNLANIETYVRWLLPAATLTGYAIASASFFMPLIAATGVDALLRLVYIYYQNGITNPASSFSQFLNSYKLDILSDNGALFTNKLKDAVNQYKNDNNAVGFFAQLKSLLTNLVTELLSTKEGKEVSLYTKEALYGVPHLYSQTIKERALRSTDYFGAIKQSIYANNDYEGKTKHEATIEALVEYNSFRHNNTNNPNYSTASTSYLRRRYLDAYWYNKIYPKSFSMNVVRLATSHKSFVYLTGGLVSGLSNVLQGLLTNTVFGRNVGKSTFKGFLHAFKSMIFAKDSEMNNHENDVILKLSKQLASSSYGGIVSYDESLGFMSTHFNLLSTGVMQSMGESIITRVVLNSVISNHNLIDENGKKINLLKYIKVSDNPSEDGIFIFDKIKYKEDTGSESLYFKNIGNLDNESYIANLANLKEIQLNGVLNSGLNRKDKEGLTDLDLHYYLNYHLLNEIDNYKRNTQGEYNPLQKPLFANSNAVGYALFQFKNHIIPLAINSLSSVYNGVATIKDSVISSTFLNNVSKYSKQNLIQLSGLSNTMILEDYTLLGTALKKLTTIRPSEKKIEEVVNKIITYKSDAELDADLEQHTFKVYDIFNSYMNIIKNPAKRAEELAKLGKNKSLIQSLVSKNLKDKKLSLQEYEQVILTFQRSDAEAIDLLREFMKYRNIKNIVSNPSSYTDKELKDKVRATVYNEYIRFQRDNKNNLEYVNNLLRIMTTTGALLLTHLIPPPDKENEKILTFLLEMNVKMKSEFIRTLVPLLEPQNLGFTMDKDHHIIWKGGLAFVAYDDFEVPLRYLLDLPGLRELPMIGGFYDNKTQAAIDRLEAENPDIKVSNYSHNLRLDKNGEIIVSGKYFYEDSKGVIRSRSTVIEDLFNTFLGAQFTQFLIQKDLIEVDPKYTQKLKDKLNQDFLTTFNTKVSNSYFRKFGEEMTVSFKQKERDDEEEQQ